MQKTEKSKSVIDVSKCTKYTSAIRFVKYTQVLISSWWKQHISKTSWSCRQFVLSRLILSYIDVPQNYLSKKRIKFGYCLRFPLFLPLKKNLWTYAVFHNAEMQVKFLSSGSIFINLEEGNVDDQLK